MKVEANIVKQYADSDVGERIELLIKHYPNFIRLVEGYEQSLSFIIKQEKECGAYYKIDKVVLIKLDPLREYINSFKTE